MRDRRKEGQLIKKAIIKAMLPAHLISVSVRGGKGTSGGWWYVDIEDHCAAGCSCTFESWGTRNTCQPCSDKWNRITEAATKAAVNSGAQVYSSDGRPDLCLQVSLNQPQPITKQTARP